MGLGFISISSSEGFHPPLLCAGTSLLLETLGASGEDIQGVMGRPGSGCLCFMWYHHWQQDVF